MRLKPIDNIRCSTIFSDDVSLNLTSVYEIQLNPAISNPQGKQKIVGIAGVRNS